MGCIGLLWHALRRMPCGGSSISKKKSASWTCAMTRKKPRNRSRANQWNSQSCCKISSYLQFRRVVLLAIASRSYPYADKFQSTVNWYRMGAGRYLSLFFKGESNRDWRIRETVSMQSNCWNRLKHSKGGGVVCKFHTPKSKSFWVIWGGLRDFGSNEPN